MIEFMVYQQGAEFTAIASDGNVGFGPTAEAAIADLQLCYDDAEFDVFDLVFEGE